MRVALGVAMGPLILFVSTLLFGISGVYGAQASSQYSALSQCAETAQTPQGFRIELNPWELHAGKSSELDAIGRVLMKYPSDRVSVQVYEESDPVRDAEKIREHLIEAGVEPQQISLSGTSQPESTAEASGQTNPTPTSMWIEIQPVT
jgi:hypothetical protein